VTPITAIPGEDYDREHSQAALPVFELESQLAPSGMLQEFRELISSAEWTPVTVGQAIRRLWKAGEATGIKQG
jgi:hypothetical protein